MGVAFRAIFQIASLIGLGATFERWFSPGEDTQESSPLKAITSLLLVAAAIYVVYKFIGKKIRIG
jgi:hypothetical protein